MKKIIYILMVAALVAVGYHAFKSGQVDNGAGGQESTYSKGDIGIEFDYPDGPTGYVLQERMATDVGTGHLRTIILMRAEDTQNEPSAGGEGPPVITITAFDNLQKQFPRAWAERNVQHSNINLIMGEVEEAVVGGANAVRYMADGLYTSENVVVAHGDRIYVITGQFMDQNSDIRRDFEPLVESVRFIPAPGQN